MKVAAFTFPGDSAHVHSVLTCRGTELSLVRTVNKLIKKADQNVIRQKYVTAKKTRQKVIMALVTSLYQASLNDLENGIHNSEPVGFNN